MDARDQEWSSTDYTTDEIQKKWWLADHVNWFFKDLERDNTNIVTIPMWIPVDGQLMVGNGWRTQTRNENQEIENNDVLKLDCINTDADTENSPTIHAMPEDGKGDPIEESPWKKPKKYPIILLIPFNLSGTHYELLSATLDSKDSISNITMYNEFGQCHWPEIKAELENSGITELVGNVKIVSENQTREIDTTENFPNEFGTGIIHTEIVPPKAHNKNIIYNADGRCGDAVIVIGWLIANGHEPTYENLVHYPPLNEFFEKNQDKKNSKAIMENKNEIWEEIRWQHYKTLTASKEKDSLFHDFERQGFIKAVEGALDITFNKPGQDVITFTYKSKDDEDVAVTINLSNKTIQIGDITHNYDKNNPDGSLGQVNNIKKTIVRDTIQIDGKQLPKDQDLEYLHKIKLENEATLITIDAEVKKLRTILNNNSDYDLEGKYGPNHPDIVIDNKNNILVKQHDGTNKPLAKYYQEKTAIGAKEELKNILHHVHDAIDQAFKSSALQYITKIQGLITENGDIEIKIENPTLDLNGTGGPYQPFKITKSSNFTKLIPGHRKDQVKVFEALRDKVVELQSKLKDFNRARATKDEQIIIWNSAEEKDYWTKEKIWSTKAALFPNKAGGDAVFIFGGNGGHLKKEKNIGNDGQAKELDDGVYQWQDENNITAFSLTTAGLPNDKNHSKEKYKVLLTFETQLLDKLIREEGLQVVIPTHENVGFKPEDYHSYNYDPKMGTRIGISCPGDLSSCESEGRKIVVDWYQKLMTDKAWQSRPLDPEAARKAKIKLMKFMKARAEYINDKKNGGIDGFIQFISGKETWNIDDITKGLQGEEVSPPPNELEQIKQKITELFKLNLRFSWQPESIEIDFIQKRRNTLTLIISHDGKIDIRHSKTTVLPLEEHCKQKESHNVNDGVQGLYTDILETIDSTIKTTNTQIQCVKEIDEKIKKIQGIIKQRKLPDVKITNEFTFTITEGGYQYTTANGQKKALGVDTPNQEILTALDNKIKELGSSTKLNSPKIQDHLNALLDEKNGQEKYIIPKIVLGRSHKTINEWFWYAFPLIPVLTPKEYTKYDLTPEEAIEYLNNETLSHYLLQRLSHLNALYEKSPKGSYTIRLFFDNDQQMQFANFLKLFKPALEKVSGQYITPILEEVEKIEKKFDIKGYDCSLTTKAWKEYDEKLKKPKKDTKSTDQQLTDLFSEIKAGTKYITVPPAEKDLHKILTTKNDKNSKNKKIANAIKSISKEQKMRIATPLSLIEFYHFNKMMNSKSKIDDAHKDTILKQIGVQQGAYESNTITEMTQAHKTIEGLYVLFRQGAKDLEFIKPKKDQYNAKDLTKVTIFQMVDLHNTVLKDANKANKKALIDHYERQYQSVIDEAIRLGKHNIVIPDDTLNNIVNAKSINTTQIHSMMHDAFANIVKKNITICKTHNINIFCSNNFQKKLNTAEKNIIKTMNTSNITTFITSDKFKDLSDDCIIATSNSNLEKITNLLSVDKEKYIDYKNEGFYKDVYPSSGSAAAKDERNVISLYDKNRLEQAIRDTRDTLIKLYTEDTFSQEDRDIAGNQKDYQAYLKILGNPSELSNIIVKIAEIAERRGGFTELNYKIDEKIATPEDEKNQKDDELEFKINGIDTYPLAQMISMTIQQKCAEQDFGTYNSKVMAGILDGSTKGTKTVEYMGNKKEADTFDVNGKIVTNSAFRTKYMHMLLGGEKGKHLEQYMKDNIRKALEGHSPSK